MTFFQSLHGTLALVVLCSLLFAEESGIPLPFAPGELTLIVAGLLIAAGGLDPFVFLPIAILACVGGELLGYSWAAVVGPRSLETIANRLHQRKAYERVAERLREADATQIAISRLVPGLRIYTTLVAGAVGVRRRTFLLGATPATIVWVAVFVILGAAVGVPVEHLFNSVARLAFQGAILIVIGIGGYFAIRHIPTSNAAGVIGLPRWARVSAAAVIDVATVASIVTGILAIARRVFGLGFRAGWLDVLVALVVITVFYVFVTRRSAGGTIGESLLRTTYATGHDIPLRPRSALQAARSIFSRSDDELTSAADLLRTLGDARRLRLLGHLLREPKTAAELHDDASMDLVEVQHDMARLRNAGVLKAIDNGEDSRYLVEPELVPVLVDLLNLEHGVRKVAMEKSAGAPTGDGQ